MECYVLTLTEIEISLGFHHEHTILGVFENKEDVWQMMFRYYNENQGKFEKQSLNQFENSQGAWEMELRGEKESEGKIFVFRAEYKEEGKEKTMKEILNNLNIKV